MDLVKKVNNINYFKYYDFIKTNKGYGLILECIKDYNNNIKTYIFL